ncbi:MotA/TolQ/ExbB proton channel family protein [Blastopirellula marina]|uniref:MotA/TolQ/ExbB proton channel family protein n=1 Tax=Blastopirellula marina TaxID=124 RepID=UPI001E37AC8A|nr:MotA/TolQ/ExbB proton channel family protein [Blastopirellula marina]
MANLNRIVIWSLALALIGGGYWHMTQQPTAATALMAQDATTPAAPAPAAEPASPPQETGFIDILLSGGIVGNLIMLLLLALSLTAAYLVFEHAMAIRHKELSPPGVGDEVRDLLVAGNVKEAEKVCHANPSFLSFVLLSGIAELDSGWSGVEKALEDSVAEQSARLFRKIEYLSVIGNIAPMVGLLGTVTGMIFAFQQVASTQGAAGAADLAEGIYQALVTTVGGLLVAIPSLGAFAVFRNWVDELVAECAYEAQQVFTPLKRRRRQAAAAQGRS